MANHTQAEFFLREFEDIAHRISGALDNPQIGLKKRHELTSELRDVTRRIDELKARPNLP